MSFYGLALFVLIAAALAVPAAFAHEDHAPAKDKAAVSADAFVPDDALRGAAFSDPAKIQPMPPGWEKSPITYTPAAGGADLAIDVNQQLYPVLIPSIEAYAKKHGIKIAFTPGMCGNTTAKLKRREIDLGGGYCCAPGELDRLPGLVHHTLGIVPMSILVNPANPVSNLPLATVRDIFRGKVRNWKEVGGADLPIQVIIGLHCPANPGNWKLILPGEDYFRADLREEEEMSDIIAQVAANPAAIGVETLPVARQFKDRGQVKGLSINGYSPEKPGNLLHLDFPFYRVFSFTTWEGAAGKPAAREFMAFLMQEAERLAPQMDMVPASQLRKAGWKFHGEELVGEPR